MKTWLKKIRDVLGMGFAWAFGWALLGMAIEVFEPDPAFIDVWVTALAIPGFAGGIIFSIVLQLAKDGRGFDATPIGGCIALGAVAGLLLAVLVIGVTTAMGSPPGPKSAGTVVAASTLLGGVTALGLRLLAGRFKAMRRQQLA